MRKSCEEIRDLLVDYVDGELPPHDSQAVHDHLAECPACRQRVEALERSLQLAKAIWQDNLTLSSRHMARRLSYAAIAAGILIVAGVLMLAVGHKAAEPDAVAAVERQIAQADTAARLLAATRIIARCEGTQSIVERQCRYILSHYADTPAAAKLRTTDPSMLGVSDNA
jgi:anti-sigma factor RsiW